MTLTDGQRLVVWVRDGMGARDRGVPLPRPLLARLRQYWETERPRSSAPYLFVPQDGVAPMHETTLQKTFTAAPVQQTSLCMRDGEHERVLGVHLERNDVRKTVDDRSANAPWCRRSPWPELKRCRGLSNLIEHRREPRR
ncbi:hypothetical protein [Sorangium sp. So ce887]|uniref:hypothetical protein n=1 Tax=Sorangium sp. So ce887 TaxID=3133324 RepID=UPI003F6002EF